MLFSGCTQPENFLYTYKINTFHPIHGLYFSAATVYHKGEVTKMLRMEIALFLVLALVAYMYFSAERKSSPLHRTFSVLLVTALVHLVFDALTIYTVNHLDTVPRFLNDTLHRFFIGTMILILYLFYQYIAILV